MMLALAATTLMGSSVAVAASAAEIDRDVDVALKKLYDTVPGSKVLAASARGILVFPSIVKGGFIVGAQYGDGAIRRNNQTVGYYNTVAASYGLQAGVQTFGYALFFMTDAALVVYPHIYSTDLNSLWLLAIFGEVESAGTSEREMENSSLRNDAVFPPALWIEKRGKTSKSPHFTNTGQEPSLFYKIWVPSLRHGA